jgi:hypothetical protein
MRKVLLLAMLAVSCGSMPPDDGGERIGSRLQRKMLVASDGTAVIWSAIRFYDTKLGVDCAFKPAKDGTLYCLPDSLMQPDDPARYVTAEIQTATP